MENRRCALCAKDAELKESHIIPKFVFNWLKESGGPIRTADAPNQRVQDGMTQRLLCSACEELFGRGEKTFFERLFSPLHSIPAVTTPITYGPWALKFAVSLSWRVLTYYSQLDDLAHFPEEQRLTAQTALSVWRRFLLGELPHPEEFEQHLLPVDAIEHYSGVSISPFLNRYLLRSVHMDVICSRKSAMVYTKIGHFLLFGVIQSSDSKRWTGTRLHVNKGSVMPRNYRVPGNIAEYLNRKADESAHALASTSPRQKQLIHDNIMGNLDKFANSEIFRALQYDVYHSGKKAFDYEDNQTE